MSGLTSWAYRGNIASGHRGEAEANRNSVKEDRSNTFLALLIAIVSLTGGLITARAVALEDQAADVDRQALHEAAFVQRKRVGAEVRVGAEGVSAARAVALQEQSLALAQAASQARRTGDQRLAEQLARESESLYVALQQFGETYPDLFLGGKLEVDQRLASLLTRDEDLTGVTNLAPLRTARRADALHDLSVRTGGWVLGLLALLVVLTLARLSAGVVRLLLAGLATVLYVGITLTAAISAW